MDEKDKKKFCQLLITTAEVFDKDLSKPILNVYFTALKKYPIDQLQKSLEKIILSYKFFPKPAEIIELIDTQPAIEDQALIIANRIIGHLRRSGAKAFPNLDDDPIAKHLMTSRWDYYDWARRILESEIKWWVKEFCNLYRAHSASKAPLEIEANPKIIPLIQNIGNGGVANE